MNDCAHNFGEVDVYCTLPASHEGPHRYVLVWDDDRIIRQGEAP